MQTSALRMISCRTGRSHLTSLNISLLICQMQTRTFVLLTLIKVKLHMRESYQFKAVVDNRKDWRESTFGAGMFPTRIKKKCIYSTSVFILERPRFPLVALCPTC